MLRLDIRLYTRIVIRLRGSIAIAICVIMVYMYSATPLYQPSPRTRDRIEDSPSFGVQEFTQKAVPADPVRSCSSKADVWEPDYVCEDENNTAWPWDPAQTWNCPNNRFDQYSLRRRKVHLECGSGSPRLVTTMTESPSDIQVLEPGNKCLQTFIQNCCVDRNKLVPNVMHYIWYADVEVGFYTFISFMSVIRFMKPCVILFHGPYVPRGEFWNYFISVYPNVILVNESLVTEVFGKPLAYKEHGSDVMRINVLNEYGGLYMDLDEVLIKPIEDLRKFRCVMSLEKDGHLGNQFILAQRYSAFLHAWMKGYRRYDATRWEYNSIIYPYKLTKKYRNLIHVEKYTFLKPEQKDPASLWYANSDWSRNYALHVYLRNFKERDWLNVKTVRSANTTLGAVFRRILFGKKELCN